MQGGRYEVHKKAAMAGRKAPKIKRESAGYQKSVGKISIGMF
ncbi:hypothetical protein [uncultured Roseovarius sp.]|nr:hypothetical protein [uncultured Roseovarius sp.]